MPKKYFNIAGLCHPSEHYMLDPLRNFGNDLIDLINQKSYFVIHAARQSGKTTLLKELTRKLNAEQKYYALLKTQRQAHNRHIVQHIHSN